MQVRLRLQYITIAMLDEKSKMFIMGIVPVKKCNHGYNCTHTLQLHRCNCCFHQNKAPYLSFIPVKFTFMFLPTGIILYLKLPSI